MSPSHRWLLALILCPTALIAQQKPRVACLDTAMTQGAMTICAGEGYKAKAAQLNALLAQLRDTLSPSQRTLLDSAQGAWAQYSVVQCRLENDDSHDGSAYPMLVALCRSALTTQRIKELAPLLCALTDMLDEPCPPAQKYLTTPDSTNAGP